MRQIKEIVKGNFCLGLSIDIRKNTIIVDTEAICQEHGKTFDQLCEDENTINQILDTFLEMKRIFN